MERIGFIGLGIMRKPMAHNMKKDVGLAVDLGRQLNAPMPIATALQMFSPASRLGAGDLDFSAVCKAAEHLSGTALGQQSS